MLNVPNGNVPPLTVMATIKIGIAHFLLNREEAAAYIYTPTERDSRRGLKRSWKTSNGEQLDPTAGSSNTTKPTAKEKGRIQYFLRLNYYRLHIAVNT